MEQGFGPDLGAKLHDFWYGELVKNYAGDEGRKRMRMAAINLRDRDGLHLRAADVVCPVLWLHVSSPHPLYLSYSRYPCHLETRVVLERTADMLSEITCSDNVIQGTKDVVYSIPNAQEEIKLFTSSPDARLEIIEGGQHFLSVSNPKEVTERVIAFVEKYAKHTVGPSL